MKYVSEIFHKDDTMQRIHTSDKDTDVAKCKVIMRLLPYKGLIVDTYQQTRIRELSHGRTNGDEARDLHGRHVGLIGLGRWVKRAYAHGAATTKVLAHRLRKVDWKKYEWRVDWSKHKRKE